MHIPTIQTQRLTLRGFVPDDLPRLVEILAKPAVMRHMPGSEPMPPERAERALNGILNHWEKRSYGWWAVVYNADDALIGWCGIGYVDELSEDEVAYLLDEPYWGRGVGTEAAGASLKYGFEELKLERIIALADTENIGSRRVMEKNGMVYEEDLHLWGLDLAQYAISREQFLKPKKP